TQIVPSVAATGAVVTINGARFSATAAADSVSFAGPNGTRVVAKLTGTPTTASMPVQVPATAVDGPVTVSVNGVQSSNSVNFTVTNPRLSSVSPGSGVQTASVLLDLTGVKFQSGSTVSFNPPNDISVGPIGFINATHIQTTVKLAATAALG